MKPVNQASGDVSLLLQQTSSDFSLKDLLLLFVFVDVLLVASCITETKTSQKAVKSHLHTHPS